MVEKRDVAPLPAPDAGLLDRLKRWRSAEAKRRGIPAFVIFHDATLEALAAVRPSDPEALRAVRGIGPAKIETYGDALLQVLRDPSRHSRSGSEVNR